MTTNLKCPFCETELEQGIELLRGGHILGCPKCKRNADDIFWFALIQSQQQLKMLEPIVASLQGRADINAEVARDSNELVAQWYEKYEQSQKDLKIAKNGLNRVITKTNSQVVRGFEYIAAGIVKVAKDTLKQIEHKE